MTNYCSCSNIKTSLKRFHRCVFFSLKDHTRLLHYMLIFGLIGLFCSPVPYLLNVGNITCTLRAALPGLAFSFVLSRYVQGQTRQYICFFPFGFHKEISFFLNPEEQRQFLGRSPLKYCCYSCHHVFVKCKGLRDTQRRSVYSHTLYAWFCHE